MVVAPSVVRKKGNITIRCCLFCCDDLVNLYDPVEEFVGTLALELGNLRVGARVGQDGVEELLDRGEAVVHLLRQTLVEGALLLVREFVGQHTLTHKIAVGEYVAHIVSILVELFDDGRDDKHIDGVVDIGNLHKCRVDGVYLLDVARDAVGEDDELGLGQIL